MGCCCCNIPRAGNINQLPAQTSVGSFFFPTACLLAFCLSVSLPSLFHHFSPFPSVTPLIILYMLFWRKSAFSRILVSVNYVFLIFQNFTKKKPLSCPAGYERRFTNDCVRSPTVCPPGLRACGTRCIRPEVESCPCSESGDDDVDCTKTVIVAGRNFIIVIFLSFVVLFSEFYFGVLCFFFFFPHQFFLRIYFCFVCLFFYGQEGGRAYITLCLALQAFLEPSALWKGSL